MVKGKAIASIIAAIGLAISCAPAAVAQESQESDVPPTMVILDASGSMEQTDAGGQTRMDAAKEATHTFLDGVSDDSELGFITYGTGTSNAPEEREAGCEDVTTLAPVGAGQLEDIRGEVDDIEASGYTPMGPALRQAADELPDEGPRNVVLVSDGIDTCAPPPVCDVAKDLHEQGIDLIINTVGFLVDDEARTELECIAEAGGGQYLDANDADSLAESMRVLHTRSINAYESDLEEYEGSDSETTPTEVPADVTSFSTPLHDPGAALNEINGDAQHWRIPVEEGERIAISALTVQPPSFGGLADSSFGLSIDFANSACRAADWNSVDSTSAQGVQAGALISKQTSEECGADGHVDFSVSRRGNFMEGEDIPLELTITRMAGEDVSDVPEPEADSDVAEVSLPAKTSDTNPGTWFDDAAEIPADGVEAVETDIVPGETHFYKVPAEYGQRLAATLRPDGTDVERAAGVSADQLEIKLFNAARQPTANAETASPSNDSVATIGHAAPLNYRNIDDGTSTTNRLWLDGEQYISVNYRRIGGGENGEVGDGEQHTARYSLAALIDGEPQPGPTFSAASEETSAPAEGEAGAADSSEDEPQAAAEESDSGFGAMGWTLGGVGVLVLIGAAVVLIRRQK
ncbi:VWA domain-containing protein [Corynebacterium sp. L4756]|uniref:vWA domain-containing protein n=1 Tax=unclassified Corynebacterium TaxID=2624378 RepID=UPI00374DAD6D